MPADLSDFPTRLLPGEAILTGDYARLEPYNSRHAEDLGEGLAGGINKDIWTYMAGGGPFTNAAELDAYYQSVKTQKDQWLCMTVIDQASDKALGVAQYMRLRPQHGSVEIGGIAFSKALQRTRTATEALYLLANHIFEDLGYRRYEWKCHADNAASNEAALRFGFKFEGTFRQDMVLRGKNRDTNWYSIIDTEWPTLKAGFLSWLSADNFDEAGQQRESLNAYMAIDRR